MSLSVLIAEKDKENLNSIINAVKGQGNIDFLTYCGRFSEVLKVLGSKSIDMIFIDTDLLRSHVCVCLKMLMKKFAGLKIVLISNTVDYLGLAFDIMAAGYIIKPVHGVEAMECIKRMDKWKLLLSTDDLVVHCRGKDTFIRLDDILFIEASNRKCTIHTEKNEYVICESIKSILSRLPPRTFYKSHRAFIINLSKIKHIEQFNKSSYNVVFSDKKIALLSRKLIKQLKRRKQ